MQVVPAQRHEQGVKSSPSSPCHALHPGEGDCICPVRCLSLIAANVLKWQPCIEMILKPVSPKERQEHVDTSWWHNLLPLWGMWQGTCCLPPQLCTQAAVTPVTLLIFGLILEVVEGRGQEAVAKERISQQLSNYFQSQGYRSSLYWKLSCVLTYRSEWWEEKGTQGSSHSTRILVNKNQKWNIYILFSTSSIFLPKNTRVIGKSLCPISYFFLLLSGHCQLVG